MISAALGLLIGIICIWILEIKRNSKPKKKNIFNEKKLKRKWKGDDVSFQERLRWLNMQPSITQKKWIKEMDKRNGEELWGN